jgi:hypothetical protein
MRPYQLPDDTWIDLDVVFRISKIKPAGGDVSYFCEVSFPGVTIRADLAPAVKTGYAEDALKAQTEAFHRWADLIKAWRNFNPHAMTSEDTFSAADFNLPSEPAPE